MGNLTVQHFKNTLTNTSQLSFRELRNRNFRLVLNEKNVPVTYFGNSSVVFKLSDGTNLFALKCYTTELFKRWEHLKKVEKKLQELQNDWIVPFEIFENELEITDEEQQKHSCNIILMPWIEGERLSDIVDLYCSEKSLYKNLKKLTKSLVTLANRQTGQAFSHGDISPANIIVMPSGKMILIDHDSFNFDGWEQSPGKAGWIDAYQHPFRDAREDDLNADQFSFLILTISLKAIELKPDLYAEFNSSRGLLFTIDDFRYPEESELIDQLNEISDPYLESLLQLLLFRLTKNETTIPGLLVYLNDSPDTVIAPEYNNQSDSNSETGDLHAPNEPGPVSTPYMVINGEGVIVTQNKKHDEIVITTKSEFGPILNAVNSEEKRISANKFPGSKIKRRKVRLGIVTVLPIVVLAVLGIKSVFRDKKIITSVDYKNIFTSGDNADNKKGITNVVAINDDRSAGNITDSFQNSTKESLNGQQQVPLPGDLINLKTPDYEKMKEAGIPKQRTKKKNSLRRRKAIDNTSVIFKKIEFY